MKSKYLYLLLSIVIVLTLPGVELSAPRQPLTHASAVSAEPIAALHAGMLQFTAGGHVIGFEASQVYLAGLDHALHIEFVGAADVSPQSDAAGASAKASPLTQVRYSDLWGGISVTYQASAEGILESTYTVAPGADAAQIRLRFNVPVELESDGGLRFSFERGWLGETAPVAWQEVNGARVAVVVGFEMVPSTSLVTFRLGNYDHSLPLVIDPIYSWHTFYGAVTGDDAGYAIAVDGSGNVYVAGDSDITWQGSGGENPLHAFSGGKDIVVVKLNGSGVYQWHTFYGSASGDDETTAIAVDGSSNIYVTGSSNAAWQGDSGANPLHAFTGGKDLVVLKLNNGVYVWHTFYGSAGGDDSGNALAVGGAGNVLVAGDSNASWQGDGGTNPLHAFHAHIDLVVLKLNKDGAYLWHTFYGGASSDDTGHAIAVDGSNNVYVAGNSYASWQGDGGADPLHATSGSDDIVVLKLNSSGAYQWHTFYGASGYDHGYAIAVDGSNNVYVTGTSYITWQGDGGANPLHAYSGVNDYDIVVLKLNSGGAYQWHTFYGSTSSSDEGYAIAVDGSNNVYVTGTSYITWQGDGGANPLHPFSGYFDIVVLKLNSNGAYQWHTFYGSSNGTDKGNAIAVGVAGNVLVTGYSGETWQGDGDANPEHAYSGADDIVVLKLNSNGAYQWHTFYGSANGDDEGHTIAVDGSGNIYVAGESYTSWQGDGGANPLHAFSGQSDIVVVKLNSSGTYQWHTFYGSSSHDFGNAITVDGNGNIYVTGNSWASWQGNGGASPIHAYSGSQNIVVMKLNSNGVYQWHTFYGSSSDDFANAIALDGSDNVYVAGESLYSWQGDGNTNPIHAFKGNDDIVVLKLNSNGAYLWHTFYGSTAVDLGNAIAADGSGNAYVTGQSTATWKGDGGANPLHAFSGGQNIVVLKLNSLGAYQWHTFYGSASDWSEGNAIAVGVSGNVLVTGSSDAAWLGDSGADPLHVFTPGTNLVVLKLDSDGAYQWHTFYGSASGINEGLAIAVDGSGNVYVAGRSYTTWQGDNDTAPLHAHHNYYDIMVLKLNKNGVYQWHTFDGCDSYDEGNGIALEGNNSIYVVGTSWSDWQGDSGADPLHAYSGDNDIVVLKLSSLRIYLPIVVR